MNRDIIAKTKEYIGDGKSHTDQDVNEYLYQVTGHKNDYCKMLEEDGIIKKVANLDGKEPNYFVEIL